MRSLYQSQIQITNYVTRLRLRGNLRDVFTPRMSRLKSAGLKNCCNHHSPAYDNLVFTSRFVLIVAAVASSIFQNPNTRDQDGEV